jgi:hypothetical protein
MALITPQAATVLGPAITMSAIGASDTFRPTDRGVLIYRSTGTGATLTIVIPGNTDYGVALPDPTVVLAATDLRMIGTAGLVKYADNNGVVTITSSSQTSCTVGYATV